MGPASSLSCFSPYKKILSGLPKKGRAYLLVVLVPREGQDFGAVSMGPAIDHKGLDTGLERKSMLHIALLQFPLLTPGQFVDRPFYFWFSKGPRSRLCWRSLYLCLCYPRTCWSLRLIESMLLVKLVLPQQQDLQMDFQLTASASICDERSTSFHRIFNYAPVTFCHFRGYHTRL